MYRFCLAFATVLLAASGSALADDTPTVEDLDWMVGRWVGEGLGGRIEEVFLEPIGGAMPCTFRLTSLDGGEVSFYEFVLFENTEEGVQIRLHHFFPDMKRWEDEPVTFDLLELDDRSVLFAERGDEEERTRLRYTREGDDMSAQLIEERDGEDVVTARFLFERARD